MKHIDINGSPEMLRNYVDLITYSVDWAKYFNISKMLGDYTIEYSN